MSLSFTWQPFHFFLIVILMSSLSLTVEPGRQVFALHAVVLLAQVPQNDRLCTQEVVERCWVELLICTNKMQALVQLCFSATIAETYNERRSVVQQGNTKKNGELAPADSLKLSTLKWMQHAKLNWTSGLSVQSYGYKTDGKCCRSGLWKFDGHFMPLLEL